MPERFCLFRFYDLYYFITNYDTFSIPVSIAGRIAVCGVQHTGQPLSRWACACVPTHCKSGWLRTGSVEVQWVYLHLICIRLYEQTSFSNFSCYLSPSCFSSGEGRLWSYCELEQLYFWTPWCLVLNFDSIFDVKWTPVPKITWKRNNNRKLKGTWTPSSKIQMTGRSKN